jgi:hypothetical protein
MTLLIVSIYVHPHFEKITNTGFYAGVLKYNGKIERFCEKICQKTANENLINLIAIFSAIIFAKNIFNLPNETRFLIVSKQEQTREFAKRYFDDKTEYEELKLLSTNIKQSKFIIFMITRTNIPSEYDSWCIEQIKRMNHEIQ